MLDQQSDGDHHHLRLALCKKKARRRGRELRGMVDIGTVMKLATVVAITMLLLLSPIATHSTVAAIRGVGGGGFRANGEIKASVNGTRGYRDPDLSPVVLVPGTGGTQLEARLTKDYKPGAFWCYSFSSSYFRLWLDAFSLLPPFTTCFAERLRLVYNEETERFENFPGVETRVPYWGSTEGIEVLDPTWRSLAAYMGPLVTALKAEKYVVGETLFGAPYDFRYAPGPYAADVAVQYSKDLKELIEQAFAQNSNKSVVLVAHSLGGLWALYFLNQQPLSWRKQFIKSFVSIAAPWGGTVQEMLTFASGYAEGISLLDPLTLRTEQRSSETNMWMLPTPKVFGRQPLVLTNTRLYTSHDLEDFLEDIGYPEGVSAYRTRIPPLINNLTAPGVPVSIIHGYGVKTPERLFYYDGFDKQPAVMEGDGDGTVNYDSLVSVIPDWTAVDGQQIRTAKMGNCTHSSIIMEAESLKSIVQEVLFDWTKDADSRQ